MVVNLPIHEQHEYCQQRARGKFADSMLDFPEHHQIAILPFVFAGLGTKESVSDYSRRRKAHHEQKTGSDPASDAVCAHMVVLSRLGLASRRYVKGFACDVWWKCRGNTDQAFSELFG